ncbi:MAG: DUF4167 domain-containing protein [Pseudomonadota bacterium]
MRSSQKSRGRGNKNRNKNQQHSPNRVYESAGPEGKVRGTPQQIIDKYHALARDYQLSGDRVTAENFLQHAEHYSRILIAAQEAAAERREQQGHQNGGGQPRQDQPAAAPGAEVIEAAPASPDDNAAPAPASNGEQPPTDGLGAIDAAQGAAPQIVDTPESGGAQPSRPRRPRPKPVEAPAAEAPEAATEE